VIGRWAHSASFINRWSPESGSRPPQSSACLCRTSSASPDAAFWWAGRSKPGSSPRDPQFAIERDGRQVGTAEVIGIERFRKVVTEAEAGEEVGLLLREQRREHVAAGDVLRSNW
jgi:hypothetical protein